MPKFTIVDVRPGLNESFGKTRKMTFRLSLKSMDNSDSPVNNLAQEEVTIVTSNRTAQVRLLLQIIELYVESYVPTKLNGGYFTGQDFDAAMANASQQRVTGSVFAKNMQCTVYPIINTKKYAMALQKLANGNYMVIVLNPNPRDLISGFDTLPKDKLNLTDKQSCEDFLKKLVNSAGAPPPPLPPQPVGTALKPGTKQKTTPASARGAVTDRGGRGSADDVAVPTHIRQECEQLRAENERLREEQTAPNAGTNDKVIEMLTDKIRSLESSGAGTVLSSMPDVNDDGKSSVDNADEALESIITDAKNRLAIIVKNRTSDFYTSKMQDDIRVTLASSADPEKQSGTLLPYLIKFLDQVGGTKDMRQKDRWEKYISFQEMYITMTSSIPRKVLDARDLEAKLNDFFGKSPSILGGLQEKAKRIGEAAKAQSARAYDYFSGLVDRREETDAMEKVDVLKSYKKKVSKFCDSTSYVEVSSVDKIDYSTMRLQLDNPNMMILKEEPEGNPATVGHYVTSGSAKIVMGARVKHGDTTGWFLQKGSNSTFTLSTDEDCVLSNNVKEAESALDAGKQNLREVRSKLDSEFDRATGGIAIAEKLTAANLMKLKTDLSRIDLRDQKFLRDTEKFKDPIVCLMVLRIFPRSPEQPYFLKGKCLYDGCEEYWVAQDKTKEYYVRNALRFFELNYNVDMDQYGTSAFGSPRLGGNGDVRTMKYEIVSTGFKEIVDINVCPLPEKSWSDGLYRLCGPSGESVRNHYWDMPAQPSTPSIVSTRTENDYLNITFQPGELDVLNEVRVYHEGSLVKKISLRTNPLGFYDGKDRKWNPARHNEASEISVQRTRSPLTLRCVDALGRESEDSEPMEVEVSPTVVEDGVQETSQEKVRDAVVEETQTQPEEENPYAKYLKLKKVGVPLLQIQQKMKADSKSDEFINGFPLAGGGDVTLQLVVPLRNMTTTQLDMVVPTDTAIADLESVILERLKNEGIMQEYHVFINRKGYEEEWKPFMVSAYKWGDDISYEVDFPRATHVTVGVSKSMTRENVKIIFGEGSDAFVDWILKKVPCVTVGTRHYDILKKLLQEMGVGVGVELEGYGASYQEDIDKILNGEYAEYSSIPKGSAKTWFNGLRKSGVWECNDPEHKKAKFKLSNIRDAVRKYVWETKTPDAEKMAKWALEMEVDVSQCELLLTSIFSIKKGKVDFASLRNMGGVPGKMGIYVVDENYDENTTSKLKQWLKSKNLKIWRDVQFALMRKLVPQTLTNSSGV